MPGRNTFDVHPDTLLARVIGLLKEANAPAYLVGGAVRDLMLGPGTGRPYDLDFSVPGDGLGLARRIADRLGGAFYALDPERGVGRVVLAVGAGEVQVVDVARFQGPDLMADLAGRDFSVNAMALEVTCDPPRLIDPHAGHADLQARRLQAVSDGAIHDDPVRGLRAVRLAAGLGFEIEPHTRTLIQAAAPGLAGVSAERMRDELVKILSLPSISHSLRELDELRLLAEVLPEVTALKGLVQTGRHRWDAYEHTLQAVANLETLLPLSDAPPHPDVPFPDQVAGHLAMVVTGGHSRRLLLTLAALLHDVGKPDTASLEPDGRRRFIEHERAGADMAARVLRRLRFATDAVRLAETIVRHHLRPLQLTWEGVASRRAIHRLFRDTGDAGVEVALLSLADDRATVGYGENADPSSTSAQEYEALRSTVTSLLDAFFNRRGNVVAPLPLLTGRDLIDGFGLEEGPLVGRLLVALREAQAAGQVANREQAEAWLRHKLED
jgi:putative nucleotidyltransferase with HDIG domain